MSAEPQAAPQPTLVANGLADFFRLEEKILGITAALGQAQAARREADQRAEAAQAKLFELKRDYALLEKELVGLRKEREEVRRRVEKLIQQIEALPAE
ncbi:MAG: hypothetical protein ACRD17_12010 [Terriglobales bacterium]